MEAVDAFQFRLHGARSIEVPLLLNYAVWTDVVIKYGG
jgi:hypothetical protein